MIQKFNEEDLQLLLSGRAFVTPLQMIAATSAVANDGKLMMPHVIKAYTDKDGNIVETFEPKMIRQVVSKETSAKLRLLLEKVVTLGSAKMLMWQVIGLPEKLVHPKNCLVIMENMFHLYRVCS